jgi:PAS domain S-box-containing protein
MWGGASAVRNAHGEVVGAVETIRDVTGRKLAEQERTRLIAALEQSPDGVLITDVCGTILYVNAAMGALAGYDRADLIGGSTSILGGDRSDAIPIEAIRAVEAGVPWFGEIPAQSGAGDPFVADWSLTPMRDDAGNTCGYVGIARDRSAERALEERLRQSSKLEAVGRLAGGIAHDFNNLLAAIRGYAELVDATLGSGDSRHEDLGEIIRAADRAARMTRQLLAFSRQQVLQVRVLDLVSIVREIAPLLRRLLGEDVALVTEIPDRLWNVLADPGQLEQVIMNLAVNARDAMPRGGSLTIELANVRLDRRFVASHPEVVPGHYVSLKVSDTGTGMDALTVKHVFEPFFTTKAPGEGTGLGLATVYGIVKQSGGYIYVQSRPGRGTKFAIYLPRAEGIAHRETNRGEASPLQPGSATILVVDDDTAVRELARRTLSALGYSVTVASSANEALFLAGEAVRLDLLITDIGLPDMRGPALANRMRADHPGLPVVLVSGYDPDDLAARGELGKGTVFLPKPFTASELAGAAHGLVPEG